MFSVDDLERCIAIVGTERILFSTDHSCQYRPGREAWRFLDGASLDVGDKAKVAQKLGEADGRGRRVGAGFA